MIKITPRISITSTTTTTTTRSTTNYLCGNNKSQVDIPHSQTHPETERDQTAGVVSLTWVL